MTFVTKSNGKDSSYNPNDKIYTPVEVAKYLISLLPLKPCNVVIDPFMGGGAFYNNLPDYVHKFWFEIDAGKDFFDFTGKVDWLISNPQYSKYSEVMKHSYEVADNIAYLIPLNKIVSSWGRVLDLDNFGGIRKVWILQASKCGFPFGFPACFCWFQRGYRQPIEYEIIKEIKKSA